MGVPRGTGHELGNHLCEDEAANKLPVNEFSNLLQEAQASEDAWRGCQCMVSVHVIMRS